MELVNLLHTVIKTHCLVQFKCASTRSLDTIAPLPPPPPQPISYYPRPYPHSPWREKKLFYETKYMGSKRNHFFMKFQISCIYLNSYVICFPSIPNPLVSKIEGGKIPTGCKYNLEAPMGIKGFELTYDCF